MYTLVPMWFNNVSCSQDRRPQRIYLLADAGDVAGRDVLVYRVAVMHSVLAKGKLSCQVEEPTRLHPTLEAPRGERLPPRPPTLASRREDIVLIRGKAPQGHLLS